MHQFDGKPGQEGHLERTRLLELLGEHHRHLHALLDEGEAAINSTDPARARALALVRWQLLRRLRAYQLFKHTELFNPFIRGNDREKARSAEAMKIRCSGSGDAYTAHVAKWSSGNIENDWRSYQADVTAITRSIRSHLARERTEAEHLLPAKNVFNRQLKVGVYDA